MGDSGYPLEPWLLTPIVNALPDTPEFRYTQAHIRARNCIERCIGVLKGRFLCLSKVLRYSPEKVGNIVNACAILHNISLYNGIEIDFELLIPPPEEYPNNICLIGDAVNARQNVIQRYFTL